MQSSALSKIPARTSRTSQSNLKTPCVPAIKEEPKKCPDKEFKLPAFSIGPKVGALNEKEVEKLRKKTIRRNAPPGEDLKCIKTILKTIKGEKVTVQEFISLIAPSTGDQGAALRVVMNEDLVSFRHLARKVYETITQDNSDVLLNQQMQLAEFHKEKKDFYNNKMMAAVEEIFHMVPNFDFDRYHRDKKHYLEEVIPIPEEMKLEPEEMEMMKRQMAYHRLQWLRSEGERLNEENARLKERLNQLKKEHIKEQLRMSEKEREAAEERSKLEAEEAMKQDELDKVNQNLEKTIIEKEAILRQKKDASIFDPITKEEGPKKKIRRKPKPGWQQISAADIDKRAIGSYRQGEANKMKGGMEFSRTRLDTSPQRSTPAVEYNSCECSSFNPVLTSSRITQEEQAIPTPSANIDYSQERVNAESKRKIPQFSRRPNLAPKDSWGKFY